jgi:N-acetylglucosamine kinase-like BadF-type ATPase
MSTPPTVTGAAALGLGLDAGGTQTRWALATAQGEIVAQGEAAGLSALSMGTPAGRDRIAAAFVEIANDVLATGRPVNVVAGMTGFEEGVEEELLATLVGAPLALPAAAVSLRGDMDIAYLDVFAPGEGYLVYAGTGSVGAFIDDAGTRHRIGGYGGILDDGGSGFWIAVSALRHIWRTEDEHPGSYRDSPMAREIFARIGGSAWADSRQFVYGAPIAENRGTIGRLAVAVAAAAEGDPVARRILAAAGEELARLASILCTRFGQRPIALAGRVVTLHPVIEAAMRAALPLATKLDIRVSEVHHAAARIAARSAASG